MRAEHQRLARLEDELRETFAHRRQLDELMQQGREGPIAEGKEAAATDVNLEVSDETIALGKCPSIFASSLMAIEEEADEMEEHELLQSMWDACLFLGCEDEVALNGEHVAAVTIFGVLALVVNVLVQSAIVAVVVIQMANNPDIDEGIAADMRCTRRSSNRRSPLAAVGPLSAGRTARM
jgi:hypothetical protein